VLGPHDQVTLWSEQAEEITGKAFRIDDAGEINIPLIGRVPASGLTAEQLETELSKRLEEYFVRPSISVTITDFGSQPVSVIGAVGNPGVHQLRGPRTLVEVLALAGGLRQDAGSLIRITRRNENGPLPVKHVETDPGGAFSSGVVNVKDVVGSSHPDENLLIRSGDVISVPPAQMVYVLGDVTRSGGFVLNDGESISVLRALSLAGGLLRTASAGNAKILRTVDGAPERQEIPVRIDRIAKGKEKDLPLFVHDILYVPSSTSKRIASRAAEAAVQTLSGVLIFSAAH
jgi:polysaccharide export outer membrane protein